MRAAATIKGYQKITQKINTDTIRSRGSINEIKQQVKFGLILPMILILQRFPETLFALSLIYRNQMKERLGRIRRKWKAVKGLLDFCLVQDEKERHVDDKHEDLSNVIKVIHVRFQLQFFKFKMVAPKWHTAEQNNCRDILH